MLLFLENLEFYSYCKAVKFHDSLLIIYSQGLFFGIILVAIENIIHMTGCDITIHNYFYTYTYLFFSNYEFEIMQEFSKIETSKNITKYSIVNI